MKVNEITLNSAVEIKEHDKDFLNNEFIPALNKNNIEFSSVNVLFGSNGSCKTTFSKYIQYSNFKAHVFNKYYQEKNARFEKDSCSAILLGEGSIQDNDELKILKEKFEELKLHIKTQEAKRDEKIKELKNSKQCTINNKYENNITELTGELKALNLVRNNNYGKQDTKDYLAKFIENRLNIDIKEEEEIENFKTDIVTKMEHVNFGYNRLNESDPMFDKIKDALDQPIINNLKDIKEKIPSLNDPSYEKWILDGFQHYHKDENVRQCPYCSLVDSKIEQLFYDLKNYMDNNEYNNQVAKMQECLTGIHIFERAFNSCFFNNNNCTFPINIEKDIFDKAYKLTHNLRIQEGIVTEHLNKVIKQVKDKINFPSKSLKFDLSSFFIEIKKYNTIICQLDELVIESNKNYDNYEVNKKMKEDFIRNYYLNEYFSKEFLKEKESEDAYNISIDKQIEEYLEKINAEIDLSKGDPEGLKGKIKNLEDSLSSTKIGLSKINSYLQVFFGDKKIELVEEIKDNTPFYAIKRDGRDGYFETLSEGEKTAIVFSYYLTELEAKMQKNEIDIIFIDDPISSLDHNYIFYISNYIMHDIVDKYKDSTTIFISTHSIMFFDYLCGSYGRLLKDDKEGKLKKFTIETNFLPLKINIVENKETTTFMLFLWKQIKKNIDDDNNYNRRLALNLLRQFLEHFSAIFSLNKEQWGKFIRRILNKDNVNKNDLNFIIGLIDKGSHGQHVELSTHEFEIMKKCIGNIENNQILQLFLHKDNKEQL